MENYIDCEGLDRYMTKTVDVILWNSQFDRENGNGARAYVYGATMCRADEYGWEYHAQSDDDQRGISFNAAEVDMIVEHSRIIIHVRLTR